MEAFCGTHFVNILTTFSAIPVSILNISDTCWSFSLLYMVSPPAQPSLLQSTHKVWAAGGHREGTGPWPRPVVQYMLWVMLVVMVAWAAPNEGGKPWESERGGWGQRPIGHGGAMSSTFPLRVSLYLAHKRPLGFSLHFPALPCSPSGPAQWPLNKCIKLHRLVLQLRWQQKAAPGYFWGQKEKCGKI